jgi:chromosome segregation ATPase
MEPSNYLKSDPLILLLNEVEILLTQIHLMELYVKQAQAAAANDSARIHEEHEAKLRSLRAELVEKERALTAAFAAPRDVIEQLEERIHGLQADLNSKRIIIEIREGELHRTQSENLSLREQITHLESTQADIGGATSEAQRSLSELEFSLAGLRQELEERSSQLERQRSDSIAIETDLHGQLQQLQNDLSEEQTRVAAGNREIEQAQTEVARIQQRIAELESSRHQAEAAAQNEVSEVRAAFESQLADLHLIITQKEQTLRDRDSALAEIERSLQHQIHELRNLLERKQDQLDTRDGELRGAQAEAATLRDQVIQLEANRTSTEAATELRFEEFQNHFNNEINSLRAALAEKEQAYKERDSAFRAAENKLIAENREFRAQLAAQQTSLENREEELRSARAEITNLEDQKATVELAHKQTERLLSAQAEQIRQRVRAELEELDARLKEKDESLQAAEAYANDLQQSLDAKLNELLIALAEQQVNLENSNFQLERATAEIAILQEQNIQLDLAYRQTERLLSAQAEQIRRQVNAELSELDARLREKNELLETAATNANELQDTFNAKVKDFQIQLAEKQLLLESRNNEVNNLKTDLARVSEQRGESESVRQQAQADAAREVQQARGEYEAELRVLREEAEQKQQRLEAQQTKATAIEANFATRLDDLEHESARKQQLLETREQRLADLTVQASALQHRIAELESSSHQEQSVAAKEMEQLRSIHNAELAALRAELQEKNWSLAQRQAEIENLAQAHNSQIQKLEAKLAKEQHFVNHHNAEIEKASSETKALLSRVAQLEMAIEHTEATAAARTEQMRQQYEAQLAHLQLELAEKTAVLQQRGSAVSQLEEKLQTEIQRLTSEAQEKHLILQSRNDELVAVKSEMDRLNDRLAELEGLARQKEDEATSDNDGMRRDFQAQLALLQAELSQKEWALEERQAMVSRLEQNLNAQIQELRRELAEKQAQLNSPPADFVMGDSTLTNQQKERLENLEKLIVTAKVDTDDRFGDANNRRWRTGWGWKRRWK